MNQEDERDPTYVMGRSEDEARSLVERAEFFKRPTRLLFEDAGITTGMKVLDIGSGPGDVVSFIAGDIREVEVEHDFDAVVGRFVLMYSADPSPPRGRRCARSATMASPCSMRRTWARRWCRTRSRRCISCGTAGSARRSRAAGWSWRWARSYTGLPRRRPGSPRMCTDALIGGGSDWVERFVSVFGASQLRSILPLILQYGVATEDEIAIETFDRRYREEVLRQGSVIRWFPCVGASAVHGKKIA